MDPISLRQVTEDCGGVMLRGEPCALVHRVCTDTRSIRPKDLFVALRGPRFDGHQFLETAERDGATAAVVERSAPTSSAGGLALIGVEETRGALGRLAAKWRKRVNPVCVAVAGSNGKTSTKELLAAVLREEGETVASPASFNNDVGLPLTLLQLGSRHRFAVLEAGSNHPGELAPLMAMASPDHGILTQIGREHLEFFGDLDGVLDEESALVEAVPASGTVVAPGGAHGLEALRRKARGRLLTAGLEPGCDWTGVVTGLGWDGTTFEVRAPDARHSGRYQVPLLGRHQAANAMLVVALAANLGIAPEAIRRGLERCVQPPMRAQAVRAGGVMILNDAYNANADSMKAALVLFKDLPVAGRRVAVLGDMGELGRASQAMHGEVGALAAETGVDWLLAVGRESERTAASASANGVKRVDWMADPESAAGMLVGALRDGDAVLLKASRFMRMERVAAALASLSRGGDV